MFRKEVSTRTIAIVVVLILGLVQFVYWRLLVYRPPGKAAGGGGGGPMPGSIRGAVGLEDVQVEALAGGFPGYADGPAWKARFYGPNALALDRDGTLLVTDSRNHRLRRVSPSGTVTTVAGGGPPGGPGGQSEGPALEARFRYPSGVAVGAEGTVYVADTGNHRLCRLRDGQVSLLAGGTPGTADGQGAQARFQAPAALTLGPDGALWVVDAATLQVRRVDGEGRVTTPAQVPPPVRAALGEAAPDPAPVLLSAWEDRWAGPAATPYSVGRRAPAGSPAGMPRLFADTDHGTVLLQKEEGAPLLLAGRRPEGTTWALEPDGPGNRAGFALPAATAMAPDGTAYVAEYEGHRIRRLRLPSWLLEGALTAPERRPGRGRRNRRGR